MTFRNKKNRLILGIILLFVLLFAVAWFTVHKQWWPALAAFAAALYFVKSIVNTALKSEKTMMEFVEAVKYNDYSHTYNAKTAPKDVQDLYKGLNIISNSFKNIVREKNAEKIYLQKILEMVNIGIISYKTATGEITWINEAFKNLTQIPYAKNIYAFEKRNPDFLQLLLDAKPGQSAIFNFKTNNASDNLLINATLFKTENQQSKLLSLQNINAPLDETETRAWQKLLNVMTHEIMNSVAPISSLADTLIKQVHENTDGSAANNEDLAEGLETIKKRSDALQRFAVTYRNLNKITRLSIQELYVRDVFENLQTLMQPTFDQKGIELDVILKDPDLKTFADAGLIEQVLINLITNAIEAVKEKENPAVTLSATKQHGTTRISVTDNGKGIPDLVADQIFIPFFSTRKNGNGIGLSLCKQIMALHKGTIQMKSTEGVGTVFTIQF